jgi:hypothetical protein
VLRIDDGLKRFFSVSNPLCLSSSSNLTFFQLFFSSPPPYQPG